MVYSLHLRELGLVCHMHLIFMLYDLRSCDTMSQKYLYVWMCTLSGLSYICRIYMNIWVTSISIFIICASIILFYKKRRKDYTETNYKLHYKMVLFCEILIMLICSCFIFVMETTVLCGKTGVYFILYLPVLLIVMPININSVRMGLIKIKK